MTALREWNGGVIVISHDERFITTVAQEVRPSAFYHFCAYAYDLLSAVGLCRWHRYEVQR